MTMLPPGVFEQHIAVLGKTRSGKSSVMRGLTEQLLFRKMPVCIVDPKGDWWGIKLAADGKRPGYPVVIFGGAHADVPITAHAGAHVAELFATGNRPCLVDLGGWMPGERTRFWIDFASTLFRLSRGTRHLVVDEIHNFAPKGKVMDPDSGKALHWTNRLASEGLGKGLVMIFASQRPQKVHNDTLTSAETLIAMRVLHPSDREAVSDWIRGCGDPVLGARVLGSLAQMNRGEGWAWSPEAGFGPERVKFPLFKTYDSFRPQTAEDARALKGWAEVDLEEVKAKLANVVEQVKANDPAELRRVIADLRKQLAVKPAAAPAAKPEVQIIEVPVVKDEHIDRLKKLAEEIKQFGSDLATVAGGITGSIAAVRQAKAAPAPVQSRAYVAPAPRQRRESAAPAAPSAEVARPQQAILDAVAWMEPLGMTQVPREVVAFLAGQSPQSSGFANNLGALRTAGLIDYPAGGVVALSDTGKALAHPPRAAPTHNDIMVKIAAKLPRAQMRIVEEVAQAHPRAMPKDELAELVQASATSSGFANNLGRLRTLGLIEYPQPGAVRARDILFPVAP